MTLRGRNDLRAANDWLDVPYLIVGCSVWALARVLAGRPGDGSDGYTAPLFDLVCIDEASQIVLSQGLMALAGLRDTGRVLVAGDDKQLPPVPYTAFLSR